MGIMNGNGNGNGIKDSNSGLVSSLGSGQGARAMGPVEGTNVVRVPFGVRHARRVRPKRPDHWATLVLPFQPGVDPTPPPQAA